MAYLYVARLTWQVLYTSLLERAVKTAWLALDEMDLQWTPIRNTWRLNERNYGALQVCVCACVCVRTFESMP